MFERLFQRQNIGKQRDFQHTVKTQLQKGAAKHPGGYVRAELALKRRSNQRIGKALGIPDRLERRQNVF